MFFPTEIPAGERECLKRKSSPALTFSLHENGVKILLAEIPIGDNGEVDFHPCNGIAQMLLADSVGFVPAHANVVIHPPAPWRHQAYHCASVMNLVNLPGTVQFHIWNRHEAVDHILREPLYRKIRWCPTYVARPMATYCLRGMQVNRQHNRDATQNSQGS